MSNRYPSVTPSDLGDHPELATLEIPDSALMMTKFAIIAVHPDLADIDPAAVPSTIEELAAAHVLNAVDTLQRGTELYRGVVKTDARWVRLSLQGTHDDPRNVSTILRHLAREFSVDHLFFLSSERSVWRPTPYAQSS